MAGFKSQAPRLETKRDQHPTEWRRRSLVRVRRPAWTGQTPTQLPGRTTQNDIAW